MEKETIFALIRNAVIVLSTGAAINGYTVTGSDAQQIAGGVLAALGVLWSFAQKKGWVSA